MHLAVHLGKDSISPGGPMLAAYAAGPSLPPLVPPGVWYPLPRLEMPLGSYPYVAPGASLEAWLDEAWRRVARERIVRLSASHGLAEAHWHRHETQRLAAGADPTPVEFFDVAVAVARELHRLGVEP